MKSSSRTLVIALLAWAGIGGARALDYSVPEKFLLRNGFRLIVKADRSLPLASLVLVAHAGSIHDDDATAGTGALIARVWDSPAELPGLEDLARTLEERGAILHVQPGALFVTGRIELPSDTLDSGLLMASRWLSLREVPDGVLDAARRKTLRLVEDLQDHPAESGLVEELSRELAFPGHPLARPVAGTPEGLGRVTAESFRAQLAARLSPARAALVVVGDVDPGVILTRVQELFDAPSAPFELPADFAGEQPAGSRDRVLYTDAVETAVGAVSFITPPVDHPDTDAIELLRKLLTHGRSSRLQVRLVELTGQAKTVTSLETRMPLSNLVSFQMTATGDDCAPAARVVLEELAGLGRREVDPTLIDRVRQGVKARRALDRQTQLQQAEALARAELSGDLDLELDRNRRLDEVSPADIRRVARAWFGPGHAHFLHIRPRSAEDVTTTADVLQQELGRGVTGILRRDPSTDVMGVSIYLSSGTGMEPDGAKGISGLLESYLGRAGTTRRPAREVQALLERTGASIRVLGGGFAGTLIAVNATVYSFDELLELLRDIVLEPDFDGPTLERVRTQQLDLWKEIVDHPEDDASQLLWETLHAGSPQTLPTRVAMETLRKATLDDLKEHHQRVLERRPIVIGVTGNLAPERVFGRVRELFVDAIPGAVEASEEVAPDGAAPARVPAPGPAIRSTSRPYDSVWIGYRLPAGSHDELAALTVWLNLLGIRSDSVLASLAREADPGFEMLHHGVQILPVGGLLSLGVRVSLGKGAGLARAYREATKNLASTEIPEGQVESTRRLITTHFVRRFQDKVQQSANLTFAAGNLKAPDFYEKLAGRYQAVTVDELRTIAREYLADPYVVVFEGRGAGEEP